MDAWDIISLCLFAFFVSIAIWWFYQIAKEYKRDRERKKMIERAEREEMRRLKRMAENQESFEDALLKIQRFEEYVQEGKTTSDIPEEEIQDFITYIVYQGKQKTKGKD